MLKSRQITWDLLQAQITFEDDDVLQEPNFMSEEPVTTARPSRRRNDRRKQKKFEDFEATTKSAHMTDSTEVRTEITFALSRNEFIKLVIK